jgi:hypothetical protein
LVKKTENLKVENYSASFPLCRAGKQRGIVQGRGFEKVIDNQLLDSTSGNTRRRTSLNNTAKNISQ